MIDWKMFFKRMGQVPLGEIHWSAVWVEDLYQAFSARRDAEVKERLTRAFGLEPCRCPDPYLTQGDRTGMCYYRGKDEACNHPSNKPPEPECEHGSNEYLCRDCGIKL